VRVAVRAILPLLDWCGADGWVNGWIEMSVVECGENVYVSAKGKCVSTDERIDDGNGVRGHQS